MTINPAETERNKWNGVDTGLVVACVLCTIGGFFSPGFFGFAISAGAAEFIRYNSRKSEKQIADFLSNPPPEFQETFNRLASLQASTDKDNPSK